MRETGKGPRSRQVKEEFTKSLQGMAEPDVLAVWEGIMELPEMALLYKASSLDTQLPDWMRHFARSKLQNNEPDTR